MISKPNSNEYNPFYQPYIDRLTSDEIVPILKEELRSTEAFFNGLSEEQGDYRYAAGKWSVKEVLNHINDIERIFTYRAMCIARGETQSLPGMDQDVYQENSGATSRTLASLVEEFVALRKASILLFDHMTEADGLKIGEASGSKVSVRALAALTAGHSAHHVKVIQEKYL
ncbi:DinB family protein [Roseivirga sp.]|uniref:DinB family protein n=1 Tax=Roseivirga sp. TaxID=1964215 RepID=UPI003B8C99AC